MHNRILLVDDEPDIVLTLKRRLEANGYEVLTASKGSEAIEMVRRDRPDLILLDILMPDMDGTQVSHAIRQEPETRSIPIIFLTALQTKRDESERGQMVGNELIFAKPFDSKKLLSQIESIFNSRPSPRT